MPIGEWVTTETVTDSKLGPIQVQVKYLQGYATDSYRPDKSAPINRLAAYSYFDYEMQKYNVNKRVYTLNNFVHQEYAQFLIPRAVGYSAGLLNYFFHGKLEITPPDQQVYGVIDGSIIPQQFATIKAKVKNATPNEAISTGSLVAIAGYKIDPDYAPDISNNPTANALAPFAYSVSAPVTISPAKLATINSTPTEFTFDFSSSKIPAGVTDLTLQVVFKGSLGNETDNAVAVGMRNVSEPTHHVFWNASDMFSLDNQLKTAVEIKATPLLAERVDNNHNGIYNESGEAYIDPYSMNFEVAYSTTSSTSTITPTLVTATLPAGRHMRLVGIFDQEVPNYLKLLYSGAGIGSASYFVTGISGAVAQNGASTTAIAAFRYWNNAGAHVPVRQHYNVAIISCKPLSVRADGSTFCAYPEEQAIAADKNPYPVGTIAVP